MTPQTLMAISHEKLWGYLEHLPFDKGKQLHVHAVSLYATAIELISDMLALDKAISGKGIPIIARSLVEACIDLENLLADASYAKRLKVKYLHDIIRIERSTIQSVGDPRFDYVNEEKLRERLRLNRIELRALKAQGIKPVSFPDKFELLGLTDEYANITPILNQFAHNTFEALIRRHVVVGDDGIELRVFSGKNSGDNTGMFAFALVMIIRSSAKIHERFRSSVSEEVSKFCHSMIVQLDECDPWIEES